MGLGKKLRKAWKKSFGKIEDTISPIKGTVIGLPLTIATGNPLFALAGSGYDMAKHQERQQEKALNAQIASSEKIAQMQQNTVISAAPIPTQTQETAAISEQNNATKKARAFRLANSVRGGTLGGGSSNNKKLTLG
jgi:hypothetical protein